jgi:hypothetical protein
MDNDYKENMFLHILHQVMHKKREFRHCLAMGQWGNGHLNLQFVDEFLLNPKVLLDCERNHSQHEEVAKDLIHS